MQYRREIDGLRAVAIIPVIMFHAGFSIFGGGFVGVDVFFVISGYLITGIIIHDLEMGEFSIAGFYERRARRILPALFTVMGCCIPFSWLWMPPMQYADFAKSMASVVLFLSNIHFLDKAGYFGPDSGLQPLLHTWSLAVEEQYYLLFPLLLVALWRLGLRRILFIIVILSIFSLAFSEWGARHQPDKNFFFSISRFWELLTGSICALLSRHREQRSNEYLAASGLAGIVFSVFFYTENTPFPSIYAVLPVLGAALVILFAASGTFIAKLLSNKVFVGIGLISYSAYLWHQPLFAFARIRSFQAPGPVLLAVLTALSLALAYLTWRYIEQPFRRRPIPLLAIRRALFGTSAAIGAAFVAFSLYGTLSNGIKWRMPEKVTAIEKAATPVALKCASMADCHAGTGKNSAVVLVGDSHAGRYAWSIDQILADHGSVRVISAPWCAPLLEFRIVGPERNARVCNFEFQKLLKNLLADGTVGTVVLSAEWANYATGIRSGSLVSAYTFQNDGNVRSQNNAIEFGRAFSYTVDQFRRAGKNVLVVDSVPEFGFSVPIRLAQAVLYGFDVSALDLPIADFRLRNSAVIAAFGQGKGFVRFFRPADYLCDRLVCRPYGADHLPLYNDGNHLAAEGLALVVPHLLGLLQLR